MLTPPFTAGQEITAASLAAAAPLAAFKFADQNSGQSNTVLQNDSDLTIAMAAGGVYVFFGKIIYTASTVADYQCTFAVISGAAAFTESWWSAEIYTTTGGAAFTQPAVPLALGTTAALGGQGTAQNQWFGISGAVVMGATAGTLQYQFAQNTTDATNLNTRAGSYLLAWKIA